MTWRPDPTDERDPRRVRSLLDTVTGRFGAPRSDVLTAIFAHWGELVGETVAAHARPDSLSHGRLVVSVESPAWATQLRFLAGDLLARVAHETGSDDVREVVIRVRR